MKHDIRALTNTLLAASNVLVREAGRLFRPHGISTVQFNVLNLLIDAPAGLRPSELTAALVVDASSTTYVLDRMEKLGWLQRVDDKTDRRAWRIQLTSAGRKLHATVAPHYDAALAELVRNLGPVKIPALITALTNIQEAAAAAVDEVLAAQAAASRNVRSLPRR